LLFLPHEEFPSEHFQDNAAETSLTGNFFGCIGSDCNVFIKIFSFCPSSSLEKLGLQRSPPSRVALQALLGSLLGLPQMSHFILLCSIPCISRSFCPCASFLFPTQTLFFGVVNKKSNSVFAFVQNTDFYELSLVNNALGSL